MKKFKVYFEQVNWTVYEVEARDRESAINKASRMWEQCEGKSATVSSVETLKAETK
jgi:hypothetical protein